MSKIVVVLIPGRAAEFLTVDDGDTTISSTLSYGAMPIESYWCEGEEFYFARAPLVLTMECSVAAQ
ncbi:hypothetical protein [Kosakonia cowanii]|uniref:hypothetical protein n=1 Tax=Kosakonia cowanii TaxID=208223 RepID=UPI0028AA7A91|nr:hypothetical protein [Kosakonia cowanii]